MVTVNVIHREPRLIGWVLSLAMLAFLCWGSLQILTGTVSLFQGTLRSSFINSLRNKDYILTERYIQTMVNFRGANGIFQIYDLFELLPTYLDNLEYSLSVRKAFEVLSLTSSNKFLEAQSKIESLKDFLEETRYIDKHQNSSKLKAHIAQFEESWRRYQEQLAKRNDIVLAVKDVNSQHQLILNEYKMIAEEFASLLSLKPEIAEDKDTLPIYKNGILRGLPVISSLPDGITDLVDLRAELKLAGGSVALESSANIYEQFQSKLTEIKKSTSNLLESKNKIQTNLQEVEEANLIINKNITRTERAVRRIAVDFLIDISSS